MMINIEACVIRYLSEAFPGVAVFGEVPENKTETMLVVDRTGGSILNLVPTSSVVVDSYAPSKAETSVLNDEVIDAMMTMPAAVTEIASVALNSTYNDTDTANKEYRYGALFEIVHA